MAVRPTPKITELLSWKGINNVNRMISQGNTPTAIYKYVTVSGIKITFPTVIEYIKLRKQAVAEKVTVESLIAPATPKVTTTDRTALTLRSMVSPDDSKKLRSELDVLDLIVQRGYSTIVNNPDEPMPISATLAAIKLKHDLTNGSHNFLTGYGMQQLKETEARKYNLLLRVLFSYIPTGLYQKALDTLQDVEDAFYKTTPYYEDYLRSDPALSEEQVQERLGAWRVEKAKGEINIDFEQFLHEGE